MAFTHGKDSRIAVGEYSFSARVNKIMMQHSREYAEVSALGDSGERSLPGLNSGAFNFEGMFESGASGHTKLMAMLGTDNGFLSTVGPKGFAVGSPTLTVLGDPKNYEIPSSVHNAVGLKYDVQPDDGVDWGVSLHDIITSETTNGNSTSVDNTAGTTNGGVASIHAVTTTGTQIIVKVQHSTDNFSGSIVDLVTFSTITTTPTSERILVTAGTTVNRYLRALWTITGAGPYLFVVAFARR